MIRKALINLEDIKQYRPIAEVPQARLDPYIFEAQQQDLRPLMNDALYTDFIAKYDVSTDPMYASYQTLLAGENYLYAGRTIEYPGIRPILVYYALARFALNNPINLTSYGVTTKNNPMSTPLDQKSLDKVVTELRAIAFSYGVQFQKYAYIKIATYVLYGYKYSQSEVNSGGIRFF